MGFQYLLGLQSSIQMKIQVKVSPEKEKAIRKHFDRQLRDFKKQALILALENDYPYIEALLSIALMNIEQNIKRGAADIRESEIQFYVQSLEDSVKK